VAGMSSMQAIALSTTQRTNWVKRSEAQLIDRTIA
jgi:hypothetical protein